MVTGTRLASVTGVIGLLSTSLAAWFYWPNTHHSSKTSHHTFHFINSTQLKGIPQEKPPPKNLLQLAPKYFNDDEEVISVLSERQADWVLLVTVPFVGEAHSLSITWLNALLQKYNMRQSTSQEQFEELYFGVVDGIKCPGLVSALRVLRYPSIRCIRQHKVKACDGFLQKLHDKHRSLIDSTQHYEEQMSTFVESIAETFETLIKEEHLLDMLPTVTTLSNNSIIGDNNNIPDASTLGSITLFYRLLKRRFLGKWSVLQVKLFNWAFWALTEGQDLFIQWLEHNKAQFYPPVIVGVGAVVGALAYQIMRT